MNLTQTKFYLSCLGGILLAIPAGFTVDIDVQTAGVSSLTQAVSQDDLRAGDEAFAAKNYPIAASFYIQHLNAVREKGDVNEERAAYERLLDALVLSKLTEQAEKYLAEYEKRFPENGKNNLSADIWHGEILSQKKQFKEAEKLYAKWLKQLPKQDPRRTRILFSYGLVLENQKRFKDAGTVFESLWKQTGNTQPGRLAFEQLVLCSAAAGQPGYAETLLLTYPPGDRREDNERYAILSVYILMRNEGVEIASGAWKYILQFFKGQANSLQYLIASSFGDAFFKAGDHSNALLSYRAAFHSASSQHEMHDTLNRIIAVISATGDTAKAAQLAVSQLDLLKHSALKPELKLRTARLLRDSGNTKDALTLYESVFAGLNSTDAEQYQALYEYAMLLGKTGLLDKAIKTVQSFCKGRKEADGEFMLGDILVRLGRKDLFPQRFEDIAARWPKHAEKALLQGIKGCIETDLPSRALDMIGRLRLLPKKSPKTEREMIYTEAASRAALKQHEYALQLYEKYLQQKPIDHVLYPQALYHAGSLALMSGKYRQAINLFNRLKHDYPQHHLAPAACAWLIHTYEILNEELPAERETWILADKYPDSEYAADALFRLASRYADEGAREKATIALRKLAADSRFPRIQARAIYELATHAGKGGNTTEALRLLQRIYDAFSDTPILADAYYLHADLLREHSDFKSAIPFYRKVINTRPNTPIAAAACGSIGDCLLAIASSEPDKSANELTAAAAAYKSMMQVSGCPPAFEAMGYYRLGRCYELQGDKQSAAQEYLKLLYKFPAIEAKTRPAVTVWCVRAAESLINIAEKQTLRSTLRNARTALHWLSDAELITVKQAADRFDKLKINKFNP